MNYETLRLTISPDLDPKIAVRRSLRFFGLAPKLDPDAANAKAASVIFSFDHPDIAQKFMWAVKPEMRAYFRALRKAEPGFAFFLPTDQSDLHQVGMCLLEDAAFGQFTGSKSGSAVVYLGGHLHKVGEELAADAMTLAGRLGHNETEQQHRGADIESYFRALPAADLPYKMSFRKAADAIDA
jgi:hypothetical protein